MSMMPTDLNDDLHVKDAVTHECSGVMKSAHGFEPGVRHRYLKAIAIEQSEKGKGFLRDWIRHTRYCPFPGGEVTHAEWRQWLKVEGFRSWFYDFPFPRTVSEEDIESMDHTFWEAMRSNLSEGDNQSMQLYAKLTGKLNKDEDDGTQTAVVTWLREGSAGAAAWMGSTKQIAEKE